MISDNKIVWNWIKGISANIKAETDADKKAEMQKTFYAGVFMSDSEEAGSYTCVFYLPKIENNYSVTVHPVLGADGLTVDMNYVNGEEAIEEGEINYALFILNIDIKAPIAEAFVEFKVDGEDASEKLNDTVFEKDPEVDISGTLNVGAINYFAMINEKVNKLLNDCTTIEEYRAMVDALHTLFTPVSLDKITSDIGLDTEYMDPEYTGAKVYKFKDYLFKESYDALPEAFKSFLGEIDGEEFYRMLASATTTGTVTRYGWDSTSEVALAAKTNLEVQQAAARGDVDEAYYDYKSAYALYVNWLKANGYAE